MLPIWYHSFRQNFAIYPSVHCQRISNYTFFSIFKIAFAGAVVTANPLATKVGMDILKRGGNVVDAGVGIQYVLGLVEPQSSGLGGGSFAIFYHKKSE